jgi:hypothetical protein
MSYRVPIVKLISLGLFSAGCVVLAFSIVGLVPGNQPVEAGAAMFTYLMVDILMLFVATFMVSAGMFFFIYSGDWSSSRAAKRKW